MEKELKESEEQEYYQEPHQRVYAIIADEDKFIFVRDKDERNPGRYIKFPGGGVEESLTLPNEKIVKRKMFKKIPAGAIIEKEPILKALEREVYEETKLIITPGELIAKYIRQPEKIELMGRCSPSPYVQTSRETEELLFYRADISGFYTPEPGLETAEVVKLSPAEIYEAIKDGRLAIDEEGSRNIYHTRAILHYLAEHPELFY